MTIEILAVAEPKTEKPAKTEKPEKRVLEIRNGQKERPEGTVGGKVWAIARKHTKDGVYDREIVHAECAKAGINAGTIAAAMTKYRKFYAAKAVEPLKDNEK